MSKAVTYFDGAGRERCGETGKEVTACGCKAHRKRQRKKPESTSFASETKVIKAPTVYRQKLRIRSRTSVKKGDKIGMTNVNTGVSYTAEIWEIHGFEWEWYEDEDGERLGVVVDCTYKYIENVPDDAIYTPAEHEMGLYH